MKIICEKDGFGNLAYFSYPGGKNYISSTVELENIRQNEGSDGIVLPFGSVGYDITCNGVDYKREPDFLPDGDAYAFATEQIRMTKKWTEENGELVYRLTLENVSDGDVKVNGLYVSVPFNNNYTRYMYNQTYMYQTKTCEHFYICGKSSYVIAEKLNGRQPLMYLLCGKDTAIEYICKSNETAKRAARGVINHSYPGSLEVYFVAGKLTDNFKNTPKTFEKGGYLNLAKGESRCFELRLGLAEGRDEFNALRVSGGDIVLKPVTGMVQPKGTAFVLDVLSNSTVEFGGDVEEVKQISDGRYCLRFSSAGEKTVSISGVNRTVFASFYVTESPAELVKARADFILNKQIYKNPGDILDWAIVPYAEEEFCGYKGLVVEEGSLWGTGSYEGGICDAYFAAMKNVFYPDEKQVAILEDYIDNYVLRYLQNPETKAVNWFGYRRAEDRTYNYIHVANLYFAMYRIAELYGITRKDKLFYLDYADCTIRKSFEVGRAMDVVVGNMGNHVIFDVMEAFKRVGAIDRFFLLKLAYMRNCEDVFRDTPYASECPYDNTGYEAVIRLCVNKKDKSTASDLKDIISVIRGNQPHWWWNGSDIRWWDAEFDFYDCCHHYTSPYNGAGLLELFAETDWFTPDEDSLSSAYGGLLGLLAKIRPDGFASMSYCPSPESVNYGFHRCTGDFGVGGMALLRNITAFALVKGGEAVGYCCEEADGEYTFIPEFIRAFCKYEDGEKLAVSTDNGFLKSVKEADGKISIVLQRPYGGRAYLTVRSKKRLTGCNVGVAYEDDDGKYVVELPAEKGETQVTLSFASAL